MAHLAPEFDPQLSERRPSMSRCSFRLIGLSAILSATVLAGCTPDADSSGVFRHSSKGAATNSTNQAPTLAQDDPLFKQAYPDCPAATIDDALPKFRTRYDMDMRRFVADPGNVTNVANNVMQDLSDRIVAYKANDVAKVIDFDNGFTRIATNVANGSFSAEYIWRKGPEMGDGCVASRISVSPQSAPNQFSVTVLGINAAQLALSTMPELNITMSNGAAITQSAAADFVGIASCASGWIVHKPYQKTNLC